MTFHVIRSTRPSVLSTVTRRTAVLAAASGLVLGLAACGGDDDSDSSSSSGAFAAVQDKAEDLGYTCVELGDTEDPTTGLTGGLSCLPGADKVGTDPTFVVFPTDTVASGTEAAQKAADKAMGRFGDTERSASTDGMTKDMYATVDGDGLAGVCINQSDNCLTTIPEFGLTAGKLDGAMNADEAGAALEDETRRMEEEDQRASEAAEAEKTEAAQSYDGWKDIDAAVEQMDAWGISCMEPDNENGMWGTTCGDNDDALFFGDRGEFTDQAKEQGITDDQLSQMMRVSDGDWTLMCRPGRTESCDTVADHTGKNVEQGI